MSAVIGASDLDGNTFHPSVGLWLSELTLIAFKAEITEIAFNVPCMGRPSELSWTPKATVVSWKLICCN